MAMHQSAAGNYRGKDFLRETGSERGACHQKADKGKEQDIWRPDTLKCAVRDVVIDRAEVQSPADQNERNEQRMRDTTPKNEQSPCKEAGLNYYAGNEMGVIG